MDKTILFIEAIKKTFDELKLEKDKRCIFVAFNQAEKLRDKYCRDPEEDEGLSDYFKFKHKEKNKKIIKEAHGDIKEGFLGTLYGIKVYVRKGDIV